MQWSDRYATGIQHIDDQHRMIFKMSEDFRAALDNEEGDRVYDSLLQALDLYIRSHFQIEEECMARYRCPVADRNREAHAGFVIFLAEFRQRYEKKGFDPVDARDLVDGIDRWLDDHICRIDVQLKGSVERA